MTVPEIIIAILHCLRKSCIRVWYRPQSGHRDIARSTNPRSILWYHVIDINPKSTVIKRKDEKYIGQH